MWCQLKMSSNKSNNSPLVWQMGLWSMETYVPLQVIRGLSVNWQSEKKNINLWKENIPKCMQPYQGRTSPVCQSHIAHSGRHDTDEERKARELDQACQDTSHQAQLQTLVWYCHCLHRGAGALSKVSVASPIDGNGANHSNSADFCLNPHVLSTTSLQKLRNAPQSVSSLLTCIPLTILGLLLHVYDSR